jgi:hypothetical protein
MNNLSNNSVAAAEPAFYFTVDQIQAMLGSTLASDIFNFYPFIIAGLLGFITNLFSFIVFLNKDLATLPLYQYMQLYALSNAIMCFLGAFQFVAHVHRLYDWSNTEWTMDYYLHGFVNIGNFLYFFNSILNTFVLMDRIASIKPSLAKYVPLTPYKLSIIAGFFCFFIVLPFDFVFVPGKMTFKLNATETFTEIYTGTSDFSRTLFGVVITFAEYAIRDLLVLIIEIILNLVSMVLLKAHFNKKKSLIKSGAVLPSSPTLETGATNGGTAKQKSANAKKHVEYAANQITKADEKATVILLIKIYVMKL